MRLLRMALEMDKVEEPVALDLVDEDQKLDEVQQALEALNFLTTSGPALESYNTKEVRLALEANHFIIIAVVAGLLATVSILLGKIISYFTGSQKSSGGGSVTSSYSTSSKSYEKFKDNIDEMCKALDIDTTHVALQNLMIQNRAELDDKLTDKEIYLLCFVVKERQYPSAKLTQLLNLAPFALIESHMEVISAISREFKSIESGSESVEEKDAKIATLIAAESKKINNEKSAAIFSLYNEIIEIIKDAEGMEKTTKAYDYLAKFSSTYTTASKSFSDFINTQHMGAIVKNGQHYLETVRGITDDIKAAQQTLESTQEDRKSEELTKFKTTMSTVIHETMKFISDFGKLFALVDMQFKSMISFLKKYYHFSMKMAEKIPVTPENKTTIDAMRNLFKTNIEILNKM